MAFQDEESSSISEVEYEEKDNLLIESTQRKQKSYLHLVSWALQLLLFGTSVGLYISSHKRPESCVRKQSIYSPALEAISDDYEVWRFNGTLAGDSPYRGTPGPDVDAAWKSISSMPLISIPLETVRKIGASEDSVRLPPESGGGYLAEVAVFHQLHCLNLLWMGTHVDYYQNHSGSWTDPPWLVRQHLDHCADILRQKLQCDADAGLLTFNWVKGYRRPYENFNSLHKCRSFDALQKWTKEHAAPSPYTGQVVRLPGSVDLEMPP